MFQTAGEPKVTDQAEKGQGEMKQTAHADAAEQTPILTHNT